MLGSSEPAGCNAPPPDLSVVFGNASCGPATATVVPVLGASNELAFQGAPEECTGYDAGVYTTGDAIAPDAFPAVATGQVGSGRLRFQAYVDDGGHPLMAQNGGSTWFDVQLDAGCSPTPFADGLHCVPGHIPNLGYLAYADPACTIPLLPLPTASTCPGAQTTFTTVVASASACADASTVFAVGTPMTLSTIYMAMPTGCVQQGTSPGTTYASALPASDDGWGLLTTDTR